MSNVKNSNVKGQTKANKTTKPSIVTVLRNEAFNALQNGETRTIGKNAYYPAHDGKKSVFKGYLKALKENAQDNSKRIQVLAFGGLADYLNTGCDNSKFGYQSVILKGFVKSEKWTSEDGSKSGVNVIITVSDAQFSYHEQSYKAFMAAKAEAESSSEEVLDEATVTNAEAMLQEVIDETTGEVVSVAPEAEAQAEAVA